MSKENIFRIKELIDQINRTALVQILENELKGINDTNMSNDATLHRIAELSIEVKDRIKMELEYEPS